MNGVSYSPALQGCVFRSWAHEVGWGVTVGSSGGGGDRNLKKELVGGMSGGGSATGIYLTKHSCHACVCLYVCVCLESGRKRERIMVTQAVWLIQMGENTTRLWFVQHTNPPLLSSSFSSPLSTRASIQRGQPKEGSRAQITPCLILTGFSLYTKAYKNNERGFGST